MSQVAAEPKTVSDDADQIFQYWHGCTKAKAVVVGLASNEPGYGGTVTLRIEDQQEFEDFAERFGANVTVLVFKD